MTGFFCGRLFQSPRELRKHLPLAGRAIESIR